MTALEAALKILQDEGKPLHYREITQRILVRKLWQCAGKTPEATINAQLAVNIKKNGKASAFRRAGRGIFALNTDRTDPTPHEKDVCRTEDRALYVLGTLVVGGVIRTRLAVQVKRWKYNVQAPVIQQVRGSLGAHEQGLIISTSDFSKGAKQEAERPDATPVGLMNGEQLVALLVEHEIGVRRTAFSLVEIGEDNGEALEASDA